MASNDVEVLDPAASVEKHKETESGVALDRRHFLTALGVAGAAASVLAGADLLSSGPSAFAQFQPPLAGYKQVDVMNFLLNFKYLKATLYAFLTTGADIPNYPTYVTYGSGQIYDQPAKITTFPTQQITDLFNEMYYDELNQLVDLRNLIGTVTGDVQAVTRPTMDMLGTGNKATATTTMTFQQAIGYARMLEDLSVSAFAGAAAYVTGANLAYVSQILATNGYHAGALRLISIQNNIPYISTGFLTTTAAGAQTINTFSALVVGGLSSFYLSAVPTNAPINGNAISGVNIPQGALITAYVPAANSTFTAATTGTNVLSSVSSVSGLAAYQPVSGTNVPAGAYIVPGGVGTSTVTISATTSATSTVAPTGYVTTGSVTISGVSAITGVAAGQPISGTGIPASATVTSASGTSIVISAAATVTSQTTFSGILTNGSASITSVSSTTGVNVGQPITGAGVPASTTIVSIGNAIVMSKVATATTTQTPMNTTGILTNGSAVISGVPSAGFTGLVVGQPISGTGIAPGATITALSASAGTITMSSVANTGALAPTGTLTPFSNVVTGVSSLAGVAVGQPVAAVGLSISQVTIPAGTVVGSINSSTSSITLSPPPTIGIPYPTGIVTNGSLNVTSVSSTTGMVVGQNITGNFIPAGTTIALISGSTVTLSAAATGSSVTAEALIVTNAVTGTVTSGSTSITSVSSTTNLAVGQTISGNNIVPGTFITAISGTTLNTTNAAIYSFNGTVISGSKTVTGIASTNGLAIGQVIVGTNLPAGTTITGVTAGPSGTVTLSNLVSGTNSSPTAETLTIYSATIATPAAIIGAVTGGSNTVTSLSTPTGVTSSGVPSAGLAVGQAIAGPNIPAATTITSINAAAGTLTLSNAATGTGSNLLETLTITAVAITVPLTPLTYVTNAYYGAFAGVTGGATTLPGIVTFGNNVVSAIPPLTGLAIGQPIYGNYIPAGSVVTVIGSGAASATNPGVGTVTISNTALGSSFNTEAIVIGIPGAAILTIGVITPGVALTATTTESFVTPNPETLKITSSNVAVTVGRGLLTISQPALGVAGTGAPQTLTMLTGDLMDVQPYDLGSGLSSGAAAAASAAGPTAIVIPSSVYSTSGPTTPTVYQGFFNTAGTGTATTSTPAGFTFARSFGQTLSVLLGSTQFNPPTYQGGFFPVGVNGPINVNTDQ